MALLILLYACNSDNELPSLTSSKLKIRKETSSYGYELISYYKDTIRHGAYEKYSPQGLLLRKGMFYDNEMTGRWEFYDSLGHIKEISYYHLSMKSGPDTVFYPTQKLKRTGYYSSGREEGPWTYYYENGSPKSELIFANGLPRNDQYQKFDSIPIENNL